jgi:hypothetical protein
MFGANNIIVPAKVTPAYFRIAIRFLGMRFMGTFP